jgi:hypothetical protein
LMDDFLEHFVRAGQSSASVSIEGFDWKAPQAPIAPRLALARWLQAWPIDPVPRRGCILARQVLD